MKNTPLHLTVLSDTHGKTWDVNMPEIPSDKMSILIHAGDFSSLGRSEEIYDFIQWLKIQPHEHKLWIPGNHDLSLEDFPYNIEVIDNETGATCLHNKEYEIASIKFFGSAYTPEFRNWAFMHTEDQAKRYWENAPDEVDILVTHGPGYFLLDRAYPEQDSNHLGCKYLTKYLEKVKPNIHVHGHIHGEGGIKTIKWEHSKETIVANAAVLDESYILKREPIVLEI